MATNFFHRQLVKILYAIALMAIYNWEKIRYFLYWAKSSGLINMKLH
jgi:hypothetical protein